MPKPAKKKTARREIPSKEHCWKLAVLSVVAMMGGWKFSMWSEDFRHFREERAASCVKLAIRPLPAGRGRLICYHDTRWGGSNSLFLDKGAAPLFLCNMDEPDDNLRGLAQVVLSRDGQGVIVRSHDGQSYLGGYSFGQGRVLNAAQAREFALAHGLGSGDVFLSGAPLVWRSVEFGELGRFVFTS